jgi:peptide/nickel transport system ATP-binding protein
MSAALGAVDQPAVATASAQPLVQARELAKVFDVSPPWLNRVIERKPRLMLHAVDGVSFEIEKGKTLALVGESGCGKSTVARMLVGLYQPTRGSMVFDGHDAHAAFRASEGRAGTPAALVRRRIQMIFQDPYASLNPRWVVEEIIAEPLHEHGLIADRNARRERVAQLLASVGLSAQDMVKYPHQFSGGQRQRINIARALATNPELVVCDEPVSALDIAIRAQILNLLARLQRELGLTYLFISHDMAVVERVSHRVAVMHMGRIVEIGSRAAIFANPQHEYTRTLLSAVPNPDPSKRRHGAIEAFPLKSPVHPVGYQPPEPSYRSVGRDHQVLVH